jgi:hypothetical protein
LTWAQIVQGITNLWSASQATSGFADGGWRYALGSPSYDADMSTTQWGIVSLIYNESFGAVTPATVKVHLKNWLAFAQDPTSGAGCYQGPSSGLCDHSDTGGLLLGLNYVGFALTTTQVQKALGFLNTNWKEKANNTWYGNFGHPYAMWSVYKGLERNIGLTNTTYITKFLTTCGAPNNLPTPPTCTWWQDYNESLVTSQNADGSWSGYSEWIAPLVTAFNTNILGGTIIPPPPPPPPPPPRMCGYRLCKY